MKSISILIPCYNEEKNLANTVNTTEKSLRGIISDYELLIFNDCSKDKTGEIADQLAKQNNKIKVFHNSANKGLGYNYIKGIEVASKEYFMLIPGDDDIPENEIREILKYVDKAEIINPYFTNPYETRHFNRVILSKAFVHFMNIIMGLDLNYYTGPVVHKTELLKKLDIKTYSFAYQVEILVKLLKSGHSFMEVGIAQTGKGTGHSHFYTYKNISGILKSIFDMIWTIKFKERKKYNKKPVRIKS